MNKAVVQFIEFLEVMPTCFMFNDIEPRNTDQLHTHHYIYYSTEIKSKLVKKTLNRFTYLQSSKNIYISMLSAVNKLLNGGVSLVYRFTQFVEKYSFFDSQSLNWSKNHA